MNSKEIVKGNTANWTIDKAGRHYVLYSKGNGTLWVRPDGSRYAQGSLGYRREGIFTRRRDAVETMLRRDDVTGMKGPFRSHEEADANG